jgi:hypothetical protein
MADTYNGPWELVPECVYLLDETLPSSVLTMQNRSKRAARSPKAKKSDIWAKTEGRCYYCGLQLGWSTTFNTDHVVPRIKGGSDSIKNTVPACRSCNSTKGGKDLEDFRFFRAMQKFEEQSGVVFTLAQVGYLRSIRVELNIPLHTFWFEQH